jgi:hypothetical protein
MRRFGDWITDAALSGVAAHSGAIISAPHHAHLDYLEKSPSICRTFGSPCHADHRAPNDAFATGAVRFGGNVKALCGLSRHSFPIRDGGARHADLGCDHGRRSFSRFAKSVLRHEPLSLPLDSCQRPRSQAETLFEQCSSNAFAVAEMVSANYCHAKPASPKLFKAALICGFARLSPRRPRARHSRQRTQYNRGLPHHHRKKESRP